MRYKPIAISLPTRSDTVLRRRCCDKIGIFKLMASYNVTKTKTRSFFQEDVRVITGHRRPQLSSV